MKPGDHIGPYEIKASLGAGGMGEVYRARDPRLDREVAIKVLPEDVAADPERLARFEREAKLLAQIHHANIAGIYGLEQAGGTPFIAMECVEGETLAERLAADGRIEIDEALEVAVQIAEALQAAHDAGIVHRDLKPSNVKITPEGTVKVLDFGLAKAWDGTSDAIDSSAATELSHSPTLVAATRTGVILGTAAYMSPEQARGKAVDKRTDIWAFGCLLYEMLAGKRAFDGETVSDAMAAILKEDPDWAMIPATVPPPVSRTLRRCLQKDPKRRLHDIADARIEIAEVDSPSAFEEAARPETASSRRADSLLARSAPFLWVGGGILVGVLASGQLLPPGPRGDAAAEVTRRFSITLPQAQAMGGGPDVLGSERSLFDLSPDGRSIAYVGAWNDTTRLYLRSIDDFEVRPIEGTESGYHPFFSPDGEWIGFLAGNLVKKVRTSGGTPETITSANQIQSATWSADGWVYLLVAEGFSLARAPASSGGPLEYLVDSLTGLPLEQASDTAATSRIARSVRAVAGGSGIIVSFLSDRSMSADRGSIAFYSPSEDRMTLLLERGYEGRYALTGHLLFMRSNTLLAAPMDLATLTVEDEEEPVVQGIRANSSQASADFDVSDSGILAYIPGGDHAITVPTWVDLEGNTEALALPPRHYGTFRPSPDGRRLAIAVIGANDNIYLYDLERGGTFEPLTVEGFNYAPVWAPDGSWLAFASSRGGRDFIYRKWIDGRPEEVLVEGDIELTPYSFSPDGNVLLVSSESGYVTALDLTQGDEPRLMTDLQYAGWGPMFSPDGDWIATTDSDTGVYNVYLRRHPSDGSVINISGSGGEEPMWSSDGGRVFYRWGADWFAVELGDGPDITPSLPHRLFRHNFLNVYFHSHAVSADGDRLLVLDPVLEREAIEELRVVLDWPRMSGEVGGERR